MFNENELIFSSKMLVYKNLRNRSKDFFSRVTGGVKSTLFILVEVRMLPLAAFFPPSIMQNLNSVKPLKMPVLQSIKDVFVERP